ncbi:MAG: hypothetical protein IKA37_04065 [Spirochaetales bacterium]|nr:hypothetical protein [Spirochaetales bacterium]
MKKHIFFILFGVFFTTVLNAQFYNDSARSTAMNGAHSAASLDAFEAMLYNPAGLAASQERFGLHIMGTLGMNLYSNSFNLTTAVEIMEHLQSGDGNIERFISNMREQNLHTGVQAGLVMNYNLFKFFFKTQYFSLGFSDTLKMRARTFLGDDLFSTVFDKIDINDKHSLGTIGADFMAYNDLNSTFSMYLWMLERKTPFRGFYVGGGVHWYTPIIHASADFSGKMGRGSLSKVDDIEQADTNLYTYNLELDGKVSLASPASYNWSGLNMPFNNGSGLPFGLGFDLGIVIDFYKWFRAGFSVTDLGFMISPATLFEVSKDIKLDLQDMGSVGSEFASIGDEFTSGGKGGTEAVLAPLAMRLGATFTPYSNRFMDLECPINFTVTDFDLIPLGFLPTFGFATGVEFTLKLGFFHLPLWTSIGYFTSSGVSVGFGGGLHLGICHLDFGVRGIESLMAPASDSAWGRDVAFAVQMAFQLGKKTEKEAKKAKLRKIRKNNAKKASSKSVEVIEINVDTNSVTTETVVTEEEVPAAPVETEEADNTSEQVPAESTENQNVENTATEQQAPEQIKLMQ